MDTNTDSEPPKKTKMTKHLIKKKKITKEFIVWGYTDIH